MKKLITLIIAATIALSASGCHSSSAPENGESSGLDDLYTENIEDAESKEELSLPEEVTEFLQSEYTVSARRKSSDTLYEYTYYFIDGVVGGAMLVTTLPTEAAAEEYYNHIIEDHPFVESDGLTVTHYVLHDEEGYYGYSCEKLKFYLETAGYKVKVNFDEEEYSKLFSESEDN